MFVADMVNDSVDSVNHIWGWHSYCYAHKGSLLGLHRNKFLLW